MSPTSARRRRSSGKPAETRRELLEIYLLPMFLSERLGGFRKVIKSGSGFLPSREFRPPVPVSNWQNEETRRFSRNSRNSGGQRELNLSCAEALWPDWSRGPSRGGAERSFANLVSTFCYLSLEGELGQLLHRRRRQRLLRGHPHAAKHHDDQGQDEEHAARHVNQDVGVEVLLPRARLCPGTEESHYRQLFNAQTGFERHVNVVTGSCRCDNVPPRGRNHGAERRANTPSGV